MFRVTSTDMQSTATSMFSAYASFAAFMMMFRSLANDLVPEPVRSYLHSFLRYLFGPLSSTTTIVIEDEWGISRNDVYDSVDTYLRTKISPTTERFKVGKSPKQKKINLCFEKNQEINDTFSSDGIDIHLKWKFVSIDPKEDDCNEKTFFELNFNKKFKEKVLEEYLPHIMAKARELEESEKVVKLFSGDGGGWGSINLDHPSSFETLAMEPKMKKAIIDDLDRFVKRKNYYKKVGKAWKRGYLLYGPPGTGKSSLVAAMANYLKFDVYDLQLNSMQSNSVLRRILLSTTNRSIILIEDIDCSVEMQNRSKSVAPVVKSSDSKHPSQLTLSGVLNFIDGLWSSCGDERIIVFTTNHKDKLDPALLRPGRMDLHIHMSYCTYQGFRLLASNYLGVEEDDDHELFDEIEELMKEVQVTPAELAEELMKSEDVDIALAGVVEFLKCKKIEGLNKDDETSLKEEGLNKDEEPSLKNQVLKC